MQQWAIAIGVILGVIVGASATFLGNFAISYWRRPKIKIGQDIPQKSDLVARHSLSIKNGGRTTVQNCCGLLTLKGINPGQDVVDDPSKDAFLHSKDFRLIKDMALCWSFQIDFRNPAFLPIFPRSWTLLELYRVDRQSLNIEIPSEMGWQRLRVILKGNRGYEGTLRIVAENVRHTKKHEISFRLKPNTIDRDVDFEVKQ